MARLALDVGGWGRAGGEEGDEGGWYEVVRGLGLGCAVGEEGC